MALRPFDCTAEEATTSRAAIEWIKAEYGTRCVWCQAALAWDEELLPLQLAIIRRRGGSAAAVNCLPCCDECETERGGTPPAQWVVHLQRSSRTPDLAVLQRALSAIVHALPDAAIAAEDELHTLALPTLPPRGDEPGPDEIGHTQRHAQRRRRRIEYLFVRDGARCVWCSLPLTIETATIEHVIPQAEHRSHALANLVCACGECNNERGDTPVLGWLEACEEHGRRVRIGVLRSILQQAAASASPIRRWALVPHQEMEQWLADRER